jgi:hypothetical protein
MFNAFVTPVAGWRQPCTSSSVTPRPPLTLPKPESRDWRDYAGKEAWESAIIGYMREHRREPVPYWLLVNLLVGESAQASRWEVRCATCQVLAAIQALLKSKRVLRYRRQFLVILDTGDEVIPLDAYFALPWRTATGRRAADSTPGR